MLAFRACVWGHRFALLSASNQASKREGKRLPQCRSTASHAYGRIKAFPDILGSGGLFDECGILETVAMLSQSVADGSRYASVVEDPAQPVLPTANVEHVTVGACVIACREESASAEDREEAVRRLLGSPLRCVLCWSVPICHRGPQVAPVLEYIHETFRWYAGLLASARRKPSSPAAQQDCELLLSTSEQRIRTVKGDGPAGQAFSWFCRSLWILTTYPARMLWVRAAGQAERSAEAEAFECVHATSCCQSLRPTPHRRRRSFSASRH